MHVKKIKALGLIAVMLILVACNNENYSYNEVEGQGILATEEDRGIPQIVESFEAVQDEYDLNEFISVGGNKFGNGISLVDLFTGEIIAEAQFLFEEDQMVREIHEFPDGTYGAFVLSGVDITRDEDGTIAGASWGSDVDLTFFLFDSELNLMQEFAITEERVAWALWGAVVRFVNGEVVIYYHDRVWGEGLYVYNVMTHSRDYIEIDIDEEIFIDQLYATALPNQFAFLGNRINDETHKYYGVIDVETGLVQYSRTDFSVGSMVVNGSYLLLTENPPPAFLGGVPESKVIVFNLITGEERFVQLASYESLYAIVIADRYVLTGSWERIRLYDIQTNELVLDRQPAVEMIRVYSEIDADGEHVDGVYPHIRQFLTISEGLYGVLFDTGDGTPHVEFIVID